ncbi:DUF2298 domain-containing protein [Haloarchaeobius sp. HRN-SO-5]|uniref:DUF2298 domain-containing protein n=1 Tax=Haloarchaeobius sp. HRN-SO-5 TaxID=3446118 RepID=UPI003EB994EF
MQTSPLAVWLLALALLSVAALPLSTALFPRFPDRGVAFALPLSLAFATFVAYWVGQVRFGRGAVAIGVVAVAAGSVLASRVAPPTPWRRVADVGVVFALAFGLLLAVRLVDPAVHPWGGEKFLDYGLLKAVVRADRLPPADFWWAGERVRYYYGAHLLAGVLTELTGVAPRHAYNLALATFFGCIATGAYGVAGAVADGRGYGPRLAGGFAAGAVVLAGNAAPLVRIGFGWLPRDLAYDLGRPVVAGVRAPYPDAFEGAIGLGTWGYWQARYVVNGSLVVSPSWVYLNGDLHAHVVAPVLTLVVVACCLAWWRSDADDPLRWLRLGAAVPLVGLLAVTNLWSVPTACGLVWLTVALAPEHPLPAVADGTRLQRELTRYATATGAALWTGVLGALAVAPFLLDHTPVSRGVGFLPPRTGVVPFLLAWGVFVVPFFVALAAVARRWATKSERRLSALVVATAAVVLVSVLGQFPALFVVGPLVALGWVHARRSGDYAPVLVVAGAGLLLVVELAYARVWPVGGHVRWNTVYKVSMQVWVLWGVAAGVVWGGWVEDVVAAARDVGPSLPVARPGAAVRVLVLVVVLVTAATFPALGFWQHFHDEHPGPVTDGTTDATAFVEERRPAVSEAIAWLDEREGRPTILTEADRYAKYQWQSAPGALTGLPTVVGWDHEAGYRGVDAFERRVNDTRKMYTANRSTSAALLAEYDVDYVYVGPEEAAAYDSISLNAPEYSGLNDFETYRGLEVAFSNEEVTIFRVNETALCAPENVSCSASVQPTTPLVRTTK